MSDFPVTRRFMVTITRYEKDRKPLIAETLGYALTGRSVAADPDCDYVHIVDMDALGYSFGPSPARHMEVADGDK